MGRRSAWYVLPHSGALFHGTPPAGALEASPPALPAEEDVPGGSAPTDPDGEGGR